jgi:hypothetical protein
VLLSSADIVPMRSGRTAPRASAGRRPRALALFVFALEDRIQIVLFRLLISKAVLGAVRVLSNVSEFFGEHIQFSEVGEGGHMREVAGASPTLRPPWPIASP